MNPTRHCPRCHATLTPQDPESLCPKCLLSVAMGEPEVIRSASGTAAAPPPAVTELAPHFPQLEIDSVVGRGGMAAVYRARQRDLDRPVALKILTLDVAHDPAFGERFVREARAMASLAHPGIASVYDSGRSGPFWYLIMELIDGPNLRQVIREGNLKSSEALEIVSQVCGALEYAHGEGVVHRDIKPENILLDRSGRVKIVDFGLAKLLGQDPGQVSLTRTNQAMGTWHYMAPEQVEHPLEVDHRADIYSLGVVFYELLTGELPLGRFEAPSQKVQLDVRLDEVVFRTLEKDPARRYQLASDVREDVEHISRTDMPGACAAPTGGWRKARDTMRQARNEHRRKHVEERYNRHRGDGSPVGKTLAVALGCLGAMVVLGALLTFVFLFAPAPPEPSLTATSTASGASVSGGPAVMVSGGAPQASATEGPRTSEAAAVSAVEVPILTDPYPWPLDSVGLAPFPREAADMVAGFYSEYLALEAYATREVTVEGVDQALEVTAFADEREQLVERMWEQLAESLDSDSFDVARRSIRVDWLFPLGEDRTLIRINRVADGYQVQSESAGSQTNIHVRRLGWKYARFWRE